jgi:hypothetical protein
MSNNINYHNNKSRIEYDIDKHSLDSISFDNDDKYSYPISKSKKTNKKRISTKKMNRPINKHTDVSLIRAKSIFESPGLHYPINSNISSSSSYSSKCSSNDCSNSSECSTSDSECYIGTSIPYYLINNDFYSRFNQNVNTFNQYHPLMMNQMLNPTINQMNKYLPQEKKVYNDTDANIYLKQIIKTYNDLQVQYADFFNGLRKILIDGGDHDRRLEDRRFEVKSIQLSDNITMGDTESFYRFMTNVKSHIKEMVQRIEFLYRMNIENVDPLIEQFYNRVHDKKMPLVPSTNHKQTPVVKRLGELFDMVGGNLKDSEINVENIKNKINNYRKITEDGIDLSRFQTLSNREREMLMMDNEVSLEKESSDPKVKNLTTGTFEKIDKDYLLEPIKQSGYDTPVNNLVFHSVGTHGLSDLPGSIENLYQTPLELNTTEFQKQLNTIQQFVDNEYDNFQINDYTFTMIDPFQAYTIRKDAELNTLNMKNKQIENNNNDILLWQGVLNEDFFNNYVNFMAHVYNYCTKDKKCDDIQSLSLPELHDVLKKELDVSADIKNVENGYDKLKYINKTYMNLNPRAREYIYDDDQPKGGEMSNGTIKGLFCEGTKRCYIYDNKDSNSNYNHTEKKDAIVKVLNNINNNITSYHKISDNANDSIIIEKIKNLRLNKNALQKTIDDLYRIDEHYRFLDKHGPDDRPVGSGIFGGSAGGVYRDIFANYIYSYKKLLNTSPGLFSQINNYYTQMITIKSPNTNESLIKDINDIFERANITKKSDEKDPGLNLLKKLTFIKNKNITDQSLILKEIEIVVKNYCKDKISQLKDFNKILHEQISSSMKKNDSVGNEQMIISDEVKNKLSKLVNTSDKTNIYDHIFDIAEKRIVDNSKISYNLVVLKSEKKENRSDPTTSKPLMETQISTTPTHPSTNLISPKQKSNTVNIHLDSIDTDDKMKHVIADYDDNYSKIIDGLFNQITHIDKSKRISENIRSMKSLFKEYIYYVDSIMLFTVNIISNILELSVPVKENHTNHYIPLVRYIEYSKLQSLRDKLKLVSNSNKNLLNDDKIDEISNDDKKLLIGPTKRILNFLNIMIHNFSNKPPIYIMIDPGKRSFVPLILTQILYHLYILNQ